MRGRLLTLNKKRSDNEPGKNQHGSGRSPRTGATAVQQNTAELGEKTLLIWVLVTRGRAFRSSILFLTFPTDLAPGGASRGNRAQLANRLLTNGTNASELTTGSKLRLRAGGLHRESGRARSGASFNCYRGLIMND